MSEGSRTTVSVIVHRNALGATRYQPALADGRSQWWEATRDPTPTHLGVRRVWLTTSADRTAEHSPVLIRWRWAAEWAAAAEADRVRMRETQVRAQAKRQFHPDAQYGVRWASGRLPGVSSDTASDVLTRLAAGPATTDELVELVAASPLTAVAFLHRRGRTSGFGQSSDGLWRLATDDSEIDALQREDRPTVQAEEFFQRINGRAR